MGLAQPAAVYFVAGCQHGLVPDQVSSGSPSPLGTEKKVLCPLLFTQGTSLIADSNAWLYLSSIGSQRLYFLTNRAGGWAVVVIE